MGDGDKWDDLIRDLYLSAIEPDAAARLPSRFATFVGGQTTSMWRLNRDSLSPEGQFLSNVPVEGVAAYADHFYRDDPWIDALRTARFDRVLHGNDVVDYADFARSSFYNEFGAEHGLFHALGLLVPLGPHAGDRVGVVTILRPRGADAFDDRTASALERVIPHLRSAFHLHEQLDLQMDALRQDALDAALEALGVPAAALTGDGQIVRFNALIEPMIRDALPRGGNITALTRSHDAGKRLSILVVSAALGTAGGQTWLPHPARPNLATIAPLPAGLARLDPSKRARVLLLLRPGKRDPSNLEARVRSVFGLTKAEAHAATTLSVGRTPSEIADAKGIKVSTVRTLLGRAQDKVGARNLRDLVRILAILE